MTQKAFWHPGRRLASLLLAGLTGCAILQPAQHPPQPLVAGELARLDGDYWNASRACPHCNLAAALLANEMPDFMHGIDYQREPDLHVTIQAVSARAMRVRLFNGRFLVAEAVRKGHLRRGSFVLNPQRKWHGGIIWDFNSVRSRLALGRGDTLLLDTAAGGGTVLLFMPGGFFLSSGRQRQFERRL